MERYPFEPDLNSAELEGNTEQKKLKKSRKFLGILNVFAKRHRNEEEGSGVATETRSDQPKLGLIIDIIRSFKAVEDSDDIEELDETRQPDELAEVKNYIILLLSKSADTLDDNMAPPADKKAAYFDGQILSKIHEQIELMQPIDIDEILIEIESENQDNQRSDERLFKDHLNQIEGHPLETKRVSKVDLERQKVTQPTSPSKPTEKISEDLLNKFVSPEYQPIQDEKIHRPKVSEIRQEQAKTTNKVETQSQFTEGYRATSSEKLPERPNPGVRLSPLISIHEIELKKERQPSQLTSSQQLRAEAKSKSQKAYEKKDKAVDGVESIENLSYGSLLQLAGQIFVDGLNLRKIYQTSNLNQEDLRNILRQRKNKKELIKILKKSLKRRRDSFENIVKIMKKLSSPELPYAADRHFTLSKKQDSFSTPDKANTNSQSKQHYKQLLKQLDTKKYLSAKPVFAVFLILFILLIILVLLIL